MNLYEPIDPPDDPWEHIAEHYRDSGTYTTDALELMLDTGGDLCPEALAMILDAYDRTHTYQARLEDAAENGEPSW